MAFSPVFLDSDYEILWRNTQYTINQITKYAKKLSPDERKKIRNNYCVFCKHIINGKNTRVNSNCICSKCKCGDMDCKIIPVNGLEEKKEIFICICGKSGRFTCNEKNCKNSKLSLCEDHLIEHNDLIHKW